MAIPAAWRPWLRLSLLPVGVAAVLAGAHVVGIRWSDLSPERVRSYVLVFGWLAPVVYVLLYAQPVVPLPISIIAMAGGLAFGLVGGTSLTLLAAVLRACGQFLIARRVGRRAVEALLKGRLAALDESIGRHGFSAVMWIRIIPNFPYDIQNYSLGCTRIPLATYAMATTIGIIPGVVLWVFAGQALLNPRQLWLVAAGLVALAAFGYLHQRRRRSSRSSG